MLCSEFHVELRRQVPQRHVAYGIYGRSSLRGHEAKVHRLHAPALGECRSSLPSSATTVLYVLEVFCSKSPSAAFVLDPCAIITIRSIMAVVPPPNLFYFHCSATCVWVDPSIRTNLLQREKRKQHPPKMTPSIPGVIQTKRAPAIINKRKVWVEAQFLNWSPRPSVGLCIGLSVGSAIELRFVAHFSCFSRKFEPVFLNKKNLNI